MRRSLRLTLLALCATASCLAGIEARGDDWTQYRKDAWRTGLSSDPTRAPMTEIWSHLLINPDIKVLGPKSPHLMLSPVALWKGRAIFITSKAGQVGLHCVDQRTGRSIWKRLLSGSVWDNVPPAITENGVVYVYGQRTHVESAIEFDDSGKQRIVHPHTAQSIVEAYQAQNGSPIGFLPLDYNVRKQGTVGTRVLLADDFRGEYHHFHDFSHLLGPPRRTIDPLVRMFLPQVPLIVRDQLLAITAQDRGLEVFTRLTQSGQAQHLWIEHLRRDHPVPTHNRPRIRIPMASAGDGVVIGNNWPQPFLMMLDPSGGAGRYARWHRDFMHTLGIPAVSNGMVYVGAGGLQASSAIVALDGLTGATRWIFSPTGLPRDKFVHRFLELPDVPGAPPRRPICECRGAPPRLELEKDMRPLETHPGLVVSGEQVYGVVNRGIVALDAATGRQLWRFPLGLQHTVVSLVGSPQHLFASIAANTPDPHDAPGLLLALRREDGKPVWIEPGPEPGVLALSNRMLFLTNGNGIHAYGPAERVYRMAVDSSNPAEYRRDPPPKEEGAPEDAEAEETGAAPEGVVVSPEFPGEAEKPQQAPNAALAPTPPLGDATVLRLRWGSGLDTMLTAIQERAQVAAGVPMLVSFDWLSPTRATLSTGEARLRPELEADLVETAARLAAESRAAYFEIAPEINAYLMRAPRELERVRALLGKLAAAVREASPSTKVIVSLNAEVLLRRYGRGVVHLFGSPVLVRPQDVAGAVSLLELADVVGLTTHPQSTFTTIGDLPITYLLELRALLPDKPLVLTRIGAHCDDAPIAGERQQYRYLHRILQAVYWLGPELVAYPDLESSRGAADLALRSKEKPRSALALWQARAAWPRVKRLSLLRGGPADLLPDLPDEEERPIPEEAVPRPE